MNELALVTGIVALAGAIASVFLIRSRDFVSASARDQDSAGESARPVGVDETGAASGSCGLHGR